MPDLLTLYLLIGAVCGAVALVVTFVAERRIMGPIDSFEMAVFSAVFAVALPSIIIAIVWPIAVPTVVIAALLRGGSR